MNVVRWNKSEEYYQLWIEENGRTFQASGTYYPFFKQFVKHGYETELAFILAVHNGVEDVARLVGACNRAQGYKKKLAMVRMEELIPIVAKQCPHMSGKEVEAEAYARYCQEVDKWQVSWKRLNQLSQSEIKSLKRKKAMTVTGFADSLTDSVLKDGVFQNLTDFIDSFPYEIYGLNGHEWIQCPFINGHLAKLKGGAVLSFNHKSKIGYVFDILDVGEWLFNMKRKKFLEVIDCQVINYHLWLAETERYDKAIKRIGYLKQRVDYPYMNRLLEEVWDFFSEFLRIAKGLISTDYFKDDRAIVFRSLRMLQDDMVKYTGRETIKRIGDRINLLCAVGLLEKVKMNDLPEQMQYENGEVYDCNYYRLPDWNIRAIEERSRTLIENGIRIGSITRERVENALGFDVAQSVFNDVKDDMVALANIPF